MAVPSTATAAVAVKETETVTVTGTAAVTVTITVAVTGVCAYGNRNRSINYDGTVNSNGSGNGNRNSSSNSNSNGNNTGNDNSNGNDYGYGNGKTSPKRDVTFAPCRKRQLLHAGDRAGHQNRPIAAEHKRSGQTIPTQRNATQTIGETKSRRDDGRARYEISTVTAWCTQHRICQVFSPLD